jgi:hypothetical protein
MEPRSAIPGRSKPRGAFAAAEDGGRRLWIADNDIQYKYTLCIVMLLFSISDTGARGPFPS